MTAPLNLYFHQLNIEKSIKSIRKSNDEKHTKICSCNINRMSVTETKVVFETRKQENIFEKNSNNNKIRKM